MTCFLPWWKQFCCQKMFVWLKLHSESLSLSFFLSLSHSVSRCLSSLWEPLQKGSLCSRCWSTGGKHVFQISLYVSLCFPLSAFLSLSLTHAHIIFHINAQIEKFNLALCFLCPATYCQETSQEPKKNKSFEKLNAWDAFVWKECTG